MSEKMKGMVLAAGLGNRLRPLTTHYAKPTLPWAGSTPLELALYRLKAAGIHEVAVNAHYRSSDIAAVVGRNILNLDIFLSHEVEILGTGGAYNPIRAWLGDSDLVVLNGDVVSDIDIRALIQRHRAEGAIATMALLPDVIPGESAVWHRSGRVVGISKVPIDGATAGNFACAQVISRRLVDRLPATGTFDIILSGYLPALRDGETVAVSPHRGFWHDLRTPAFFAMSLMEYLRDGVRLAGDPLGLGYLRAAAGLRGFDSKAAPSVQLIEPLVADASTTIGPSSTIGPMAVIGPQCDIGSGVTIRNSVIMPNTRVTAGLTVDGRILGPGIDITL